MPTFKLFIFSLVLSCCAVSMANAQSFQFARKLGCEQADDEGLAVVVDGQGNQYSTGTFRSWNGIGAQAADFDPGSAFYPLWTFQGGNNAYISKLNSQGNFVWAKQFKNGYSVGNSIVQDQSRNLYISGNFAGEVDFDPGNGVYNLSPGGQIGNIDIFIVKLSSSGNFIWARSFGGILGESNTSLAVDSSGNVYVSGLFSVEADFDPGPGVFLMNAQVYSNAFLTKLDPNGNFVWAKNMGGMGDFGSITLDLEGSIFYTSTFEGVTDVNPSINDTFLLSSKGSNDIFVTKLDYAGQFLWSRSVGSSKYDFGYGIALDSKFNIVLTGAFQGDSLLDGKNGDLLAINASKKSTMDVFVLKMDQAGNVHWTISLGDTLDDVGSGLTIAPNDDLYISGTFRDSVDFDPGSGTHFIRSKGNPDGFILKLDSNGHFQRALHIGGLFNTVPKAIFFDTQKNLTLTGWYASGVLGTVDFDPGPGVVNVNSQGSAGGSRDIFVLKLRSCQTDTATETVSACQSYAWQNTTYTQSGSYAKTLSTPNGCDSTIVLKLTINQPVLADASYNLCPGETVVVGSKTYSQPGIYLDTLIAANGCDSLITSTIAYSYPNDTLVANGPQLEAAAGQDSYQWLDCNAGFVPIQGEISSDFTPAVSGSYAVRVSKGNCADTSGCVLFTSVKESQSYKSELVITPNPASGKATVFLHDGLAGDRIWVCTIEGRMVQTLFLDTHKQAQLSDLPAGIYLVRPENGGLKPIRFLAL